jgi:hypothetical protein
VYVFEKLAATAADKSARPTSPEPPTLIFLWKFYFSTCAICRIMTFSNIFFRKDAQLAELTTKSPSGLWTPNFGGFSHRVSVDCATRILGAL